ncbi:unnamed protein product [Nezara viridula]|uniref:Uncharacterized protein n=1 Tax=Nezara viridula TaxID=85310 RepID=A0A9P0H194_NEZVI|nr:unnamed protein product [Nezara viridula]
MAKTEFAILKLASVSHLGHNNRLITHKITVYMNIRRLKRGWMRYILPCLKEAKTKKRCHWVSFVPIPLIPVEQIRYLGLHLDKRLTWNPHTRLKRQETARRFRLLQHLLDKRSKLPVNYKRLIYMTTIRAIWTYGVELWGSTKPSNSSRIQSLQSKILRKILNAPYFVTNKIIHNDLNIPYVSDLAQSFHNKLQNHPNPLVSNLASSSIPDNPPRREEIPYRGSFEPPNRVFGHVNRGHVLYQEREREREREREGGRERERNISLQLNSKKFPAQRHGDRQKEKERFCTLRREPRRERMDRMYDSTESGYDGGSQENILDEPHYESIKNINIKSEIQKEHIYEKMNGKKEKETTEAQNNKTEDSEKSRPKNKYDDTKTVPNGNKFCDGNDSEYDPKEETPDYDCNKVTIHAVIETMHEQHMAEPAMDKDSIDSAESYEKSENDSSKSETTYAKSEDHYSKEELYSKLEEVYSRSKEKYKQDEKSRQEINSKQNSIGNEQMEKENNQTDVKEEIYSNIDASSKGSKKPEQPKLEENQEEGSIVQKLVKVAEDEGVASKTPTPPPRNCNVLLANTDEQTFVEEEYSYEPEFKRASSKLVLRTRSLLNLEEDRNRTERNFVRPSAVRMKITTGPDGTFVIDGRKASSELNLSDESNNEPAIKDRRLISGEELRRRKEEIFKPKPTPEQNMNKYTEEINTGACRTTKEEAIYNLKKYLKENNIGLKELLTNNNVVIIDTYRDKKSTEDLLEYNHKNMRECRITGTTTKSEARESNTLPRANKVHQPSVQRHYFYKLVKSRPKLPDEELPDPDKVRSTRQMFQKPKNGTQTGIMLPIAAKLNNPKKEPRPTPEVRVVQGDRNSKGWTDSGSLSSGVSSDMSQLDNMSDKCYTSDEEDITQSPEADQHPVSPEVMKKIRACGTTITYYGGRVISHSHGSGNQMTMTIMDEIRQGKEGGRGKFRLVKSNSCGSRLELAGTDEQQLYHELSHSRFYEDMYGGKNLCDEMKGNLGPLEEDKKEESLKYEEFKERKHEEVKKEVQKIEMGEINKDKKPSWRELIESRKQLRAMEHNRRPCNDMVFEEYQVLEA